MGTRSLTHVQNGKGETLCTIYRQFDGYPSGHGRDLKKALMPGDVSNGIQQGCHNGMECAAATLVMQLKAKSGAGGIYLKKPGTCEVGEEFTYVVGFYGKNEYGLGRVGRIKLDVYAGPMTALGFGGQPIEEMDKIYSGPLSEFDPEMSYGEADDEEDVA